MAHLRICPDLDATGAEMALEAERPDSCRVIRADFLLLGVVSDSLTDVRLAMVAIGENAPIRRRAGESKKRGRAG